MTKSVQRHLRIEDVIRRFPEHSRIILCMSTLRFPAWKIEMAMHFPFFFRKAWKTAQAVLDTRKPA